MKTQNKQQLTIIKTRITHPTAKHTNENNHKENKHNIHIKNTNKTNNNIKTQKQHMNTITQN